MNISNATEHGYSNRALYNSGRFEKAAVDGRGNNLQKAATSFGNSATKVTISPEAQALNETEPWRKSIEKISKIHNWLREVNIEALKNDTSIEVAMKKHGMEIAEWLAEDDSDPDSAKEFLEGITRYMDGQSYKEAFNLNEGESKAVERMASDEELFLKGTREHYYKCKELGIERGAGCYSVRLGSWVFPPDKDAVKPDEEDNEEEKEVPKTKKSDKAAPQDKNEIFKDFAERMITSNHKKGIESTLLHHIKNERSTGHKQERH